MHGKNNVLSFVLSILLASVCFFTCIFPCYASEDTSAEVGADGEADRDLHEVEETNFVSLGEVQTMEQDTIPTSSAEVSSDLLQDNSDRNDSDTDYIVSVEVVRSVNPVTPQEANGLKAILLELIGDYDMVTSEYTYTSNNGYTTKQVTTEPDYAWMISAALFIMVLWSLFRFVGGIASAKR